MPASTRASSLELLSTTSAAAGPARAIRPTNRSLSLITARPSRAHAPASSASAFRDAPLSQRVTSPAAAALVLPMHPRYHADGALTIHDNDGSLGRQRDKGSPRR